MGLIKSFFTEEEGIATVEIVLILVILIGLVVLFRGAISQFFNGIVEKMKGLIDSGSEDLEAPSI